MQFDFQSTCRSSLDFRQDFMITMSTYFSESLKKSGKEDVILFRNQLKMTFDVSENIHLWLLYGRIFWLILFQKKKKNAFLFLNFIKISFTFKSCIQNCLKIQLVKKRRETKKNKQKKKTRKIKQKWLRGCRRFHVPLKPVLKIVSKFNRKKKKN